MAQRICFLGRGGSGKSTVAQNLGHALALKGYHVLLVGNDISLSSTVLLRGEADISPALEDYREHYEIDLNEGNMARLMELLRPYVDNGRRSRKP